MRRTSPKRANRRQVGGSHYKNLAIQPWDFICANQLGYLEGCIIKYVTRWRRKGGVEDLHKARHCLEKLMEEEPANVNAPPPGPPPAT